MAPVYGARIWRLRWVYVYMVAGYPYMVAMLWLYTGNKQCRNVSHNAVLRDEDAEPGSLHHTTSLRTCHEILTVADLSHDLPCKTMTLRRQAGSLRWVFIHVLCAPRMPTLADSEERESERE